MSDRDDDGPVDPPAEAANRDEEGSASRPDEEPTGAADQDFGGSGETGTSTEAVPAGPSAANARTGGRAEEDGDTVGDPAMGAGDGDAVLADEPLGESRRLDGKVRYQWVVGSVVGAAIGAVVLAGLFQLVGGWAGLQVSGAYPLGTSRTTITVGVLAFVAFVGLAVLRAVLLYRSWRYEVRADSLYLTRGVLTRVQTVAPYVRVQHIDTRRSPVERLLGLSSLVVYTAGSRGADVTIPGLTDARAAELQRRLKRLAIASEEEDAV